MKKKGILLNTLISTAKALPLAIALGLAVAMIAYMILVNVLPTGYLSESRFMPDNQGDSGLEIVSTWAFCEHVADAYGKKGGNIAVDTLDKILRVSVNDDGSITIGVRTANALTSYYIIQTAIESAEYLYSAQGGSLTVLSSPSVPTTLSREDITPYVLFFALLVFAIIIIVGIFNGLTLGKVRSEKEFRRASALPVVGVLTDAANELTKFEEEAKA